MWGLLVYMLFVLAEIFVAGAHIRIRIMEDQEQEGKTDGRS